ncbi:MAG: cytochrome c peroxidase [Archangium sp.]|nr:cytochrome c peroxidase [Archangium sp.]
MEARACTTAILALAMMLVGCQEDALVPGLDAAQHAQLRAMRLPAQLPPSTGNLVADDLEAARFGHAVFFDARLSSNQDVRCATCHIPERFFADGNAASTGLERGTRNTPSLYAAAWKRWQMWDGRADSLWSQPLLALENPKEMNFTRLELAHRVAQTYRVPYERLFGALPDLSQYPARGKPGDASFDSLTVTEQRLINGVVANVGKSLEAYERKLALLPGPLDEFLDGDEKALSAEAREGARVFFTAGCAECHSGPQLSDDAFHSIGRPETEGRAQALEALALSPFNAAGAFHDGTPELIPSPSAEDEGAYHTPSLRNVARTGPWGHDGAFTTLEAAVDAHLPSRVSGAERPALILFLRSLEARDPPSPWNNWPNR